MKKKDKNKSKSRLEAVATLKRSRQQFLTKMKGNQPKLRNLKQCKKSVEVRLKFNQEA